MEKLTKQKEEFGNLPDLLDKADNDAKSNIISTLIAQIILKIPKGSKKGEIKIKVRNQPDQTFVYQNGRVCVFDSLAPEEGLEPPTWWLTATRSTN